MQENNVNLEKTFEFSLKVIEIYKFLTEEKREFIMSKQLLRSATSIGVNCEEADSAQSHKDFIAKMSIEFNPVKSFQTWVIFTMCMFYRVWLMVNSIQGIQKIWNEDLPC